MVNKAVDVGTIHGVRVAATAPSISNLCFADDTLFFCEATETDAIALKGILDIYARTSGQEINLDKSTMTFSPSTSPVIRHSIHQILGFKIVDKHDKYLGMPCSMGRTKKEIFSYLRDRVWAKVKGWGEKQLSRAGREVLIKSVLQSVPTYIMSCFCLPKGILKDIESVIRRYWWGTGGNKGVAWLPWRKMCLPKAEGGLGFRDMKCFNLALLTKQGWRLMTEPGLLLTKILKARYYPHGEFITADIGPRPSATWRGILEARQFLHAGIGMRIGNGATTSIWGDKWIADENYPRVITKRPSHCAFPDTVSDIIDLISRTWNFFLINEFFWPVDRDRILSVPIGCVRAADKMVWRFTPHGRFTVNSCYRAILQSAGTGNRQGQASNGIDSTLWKTVWGLKIPPKIRIFIWRAILNILPTKAELFRRKVATSPFCHRCGVTESILHVTSECRNMGSIWQQQPFEGIFSHNYLNFESWFAYLSQTLHADFLSLASIMMWKAWEIRNCEVHGKSTIGADDIIRWSANYLSCFNRATKMPAGIGHNSEHPSTWLPPTQGIIKINFDTAFPVDRDFFTTSMVARDWRGKCIWWCVEKFLGRPKSIDGEAKAALQAIRKAREVGWNSVMIEGDNLRIIEALKGGESNSASYGALIEDCMDIARSFDYISFSFIKRCGNSLANAITKFHESSYTEGFTLPPSLADHA